MLESKQAGFSLISVLVAVAIIGVMAAIAVPKFTGTIMTANTAKVQSDLTTLDAAIAVYELQKGHEPANIEDLKEYVQDFGSLKPPKGKCKLKDGSEVSFDGKEYSLRKSDAKTGEGARAVCDNHTAGEFGYDK
jgi:general secretion pathway protein G